MDKLNKREQIALAMLQGHMDIIRVNTDMQTELIINALDFADYFIDMSKEEWSDKI
jgi:hypothetical protein